MQVLRCFWQNGTDNSSSYAIGNVSASGITLSTGTERQGNNTYVTIYYQIADGAQWNISYNGWDDEGARVRSGNVTKTGTGYISTNVLINYSGYQRGASLTVIAYK